MSNFTRLLLFAAAWLMLLLAACAAPAPTATPTLTPEPTLTFTPAPTATFTLAPTATPELLPVDVLATLQGQEYTTVDSDGDKNIDKVVAPNGDTLYQLNSENNWQRMITFTTTEGEKIEMPRFETLKEALLFLAKNALWHTGGRTERYNLLDKWFSTPKSYDFLPNLRKIPNYTLRVASTTPDYTDQFILMGRASVGSNSLLIYEDKNGEFALAYFVGEVTNSDAPALNISGVPTPQP